jgi:hypothetical protein
VLDDVLVDEAGRRAVGERACRTALLRWSPHLQADRYLAILEHVLRPSTPRRRPSPGWTPVANDEPWLPHRTSLEAYPPGASPTVATTPLPAPPTIAQRLRDKSRLVAERLREEGAVATTQAVARWLRRRLSRDRDAA